MTKPKEPKKPKQRTKKIPFEKVAVEVEGKKGVWEWECDGVRWRYHDSIYGLNLESLMTPNGGDEEWNPMIFVSDLKSAGLFAEGYAVGYRVGARPT